MTPSMGGASASVEVDVRPAATTPVHPSTGRVEPNRVAHFGWSDGSTSALALNGDTAGRKSRGARHMSNPRTCAGDS